MIKFAIPLILLVVISGCANRPLGLSENEWNMLTPAQKHEAHDKQAHFDAIRYKQRMKERKQREKRRLQQERLERKRDIAAGMVAKRSNLCMGGKRCPGRVGDMLIVSIGSFAYVDKIIFRADDRIGRRHGARINIYADRTCVARNVDIKKAGATHEIFVGKVARNIIFKSANDDETRFHFIKVYGEKLKHRSPRRPLISNRIEINSLPGVGR